MIVSRTKPTRYRFLEPIGQYARTRLGQGEGLDGIHRRHARSGLLFAATRRERVKALSRSRDPVAPRTIGRHMAADALGAQNESQLGVGYDELEGEELVAKLSADGRLDVIEALWRFGVVTAAESVVSQLASLNGPNLTRLLLDEILEPRFDVGLPERVVEAVEEHLPPLSETSTELLASRLSNSAELASHYESRREILDVWLLSQDGKSADEAALVVVMDGSDEADEVVYEAAIQRCRERPKVGERASQRLVEQLRSEARAEDWVSAVAYVDGLCAGHPIPDHLEAVLKELLVRAPTLGDRAELSDSFARAVHSKSASTLKKVLADPGLANTAGTQSLIRLAEVSPRKRDRAAMFKLVVVEQGTTWAAVAPNVITVWEDKEWSSRLEAVRQVADQVEERHLTQLITDAPSVLSATLVAITVKGGGGKPAVITTAAAKLREAEASRDTETDDESHDPASMEADMVEAIDWPTARTSVEQRETLAAILNEAMTPDEVAARVALAVNHEAIPPAFAVDLIPDEGLASAINGVKPGQARAEVTEGLMKRDQASTLAAARDAQTNFFSLDLARVTVEVSPEVAFAGADERYSALPDSEKDDLLDLLDQHGRVDEIPLLERFIADTRRPAAERRVRAARSVGQLTDEGGTLSPPVLALLESNRPEILETGASVVADVKPRDPEVVRKLRTVATGTADAGESHAERALEELAAAYVEYLGEEISLEERVELLRLLGATGTGAAVPVLLRHIGGDAVDDVRVRRAAASALAEISAQVTLDPAEHKRTVDLLEGPVRERDADARQDLSSAIARSSLGSDAALHILVELINFETKNDLRVLLGNEKDSVVRHLQLYATERERGEVGWPGQISQLDIVAERLVRSAYLLLGTSEKLQAKIRASQTEPEYGNLLKSLGSVKDLSAVHGRLLTLHQLRSQKTEQPHVGEKPSEADVTTAEGVFQGAAKVLVGVLDREGLKSS